MAHLKNKHKEFIVKQLAMFERPRKIKKKVNEHFGIKLNPPQIVYYSPESAQGKKTLAQRWRHLFNETRDKFINESAGIAILHKTVRLKRLERIYQNEIEDNDYEGAKQTLEQAAKEMGGAYQSNGSCVSADNGGTINFLQQVNQAIENKYGREE